MTKHYHFIGIGGIGMGALASLVIAKGFKVSGSDIRNNQLTDQLKKDGADIFLGHDAHYVDGADYVVYSSAIALHNPELQAARECEIPILKRAELLAQLMKDYVGITVAGAHGKTTTTSMISHLLIDVDLKPTTAVGGIVEGLTSPGQLGTGDYFVAEVDESDGSFLSFSPQYSVITNIDFEHIDFYHTWDNILKTYSAFIEKTKNNGVIIAFGEDEKLMTLLKQSSKEYITYGFSSECDIYAKNIQFDNFHCQFECIRNGQFLGEVRLKVPGKHNIANALACISLGLLLSIDFHLIVKSLETFVSVRRRFQIKGKVNDIYVVDDYAHHPTEIQATLKAAEGIEKNRLIAIFQPHRYSRLNSLMNEIAQSLIQCDYLIITDVYAASENPIEGLSSQRLCEIIKQDFNKEAAYMPKDEIPNHIVDIAEPGDLVVTLGAGDITQVSDKIIESLNDAFSVRKKPIPAKNTHPLGRLGVLMGGYSSEREISLKSGKAIYQALKEKGCDVVLIDIQDRDDDLIIRQIQESGIETAFIALHGQLGEDGHIQLLLEELNIAYTGSAVNASRLAYDKSKTQEILSKQDINVPKFIVLSKTEKYDLVTLVEKNLKFPVVVKPATEGSSVGVTIVHALDELRNALDVAWSYSSDILVECHIKGREITVGILDNQALPIVEMVYDSDFFSFDAKYQKGRTQYVVPAQLSDDLTKQAQAIALRVHTILGCSDFSRVDFMLDEKSTLYVLEINTIPGFTETSLLPKAAAQSGLNFHQLCLKIMELAHAKKKEDKNTVISY